MKQVRRIFLPPAFLRQEDAPRRDADQGVRENKLAWTSKRLVSRWRRQTHSVVFASSMSVFDAWASAASTATQAAAVRNETRKKTGLLAGQATGALQNARTAWGGRRASGRLPGSVRRTSCRQGLSPPALRPPPSQPRAPSLHPFPPIASAAERHSVPAGWEYRDGAGDA